DGAPGTPRRAARARLRSRGTPGPRAGSGGQAVLLRPCDDTSHVAIAGDARGVVEVGGDARGRGREDRRAEALGLHLDPVVVPDQYTLGELDVGQVLGRDLVEHAEDDGGRVGHDV